MNMNIGIAEFSIFFDNDCDSNITVHVIDDNLLFMLQDEMFLHLKVRVKSKLKRTQRNRIYSHNKSY